MKLDHIPIADKARDAAWAKFIKRKDVKKFFKDKDDTFKFPLERGWYEVWCQAWEEAVKRPWVGLTEEEIAKIASTPAAVVGSYVHTFARAIEDNLRSKNT